MWTVSVAGGAEARWERMTDLPDFRRNAAAVSLPGDEVLVLEGADERILRGAVCEAGTRGRWTCSPCLPYRTVCQACPPGTVNDDGGATCTACTGNEVANGNNTECEACTGNTVANSDHSRCEACGAGEQPDRKSVV